MPTHYGAMARAGRMGQVPTGGAGRPPATGVSVPRSTPPVPRVQAPTVAARPVGRPGSAAPARAGQRIMGRGPTGAAIARLGSGPGAPMGPTRGGAAPQRGFAGKIGQALRTGGGATRRASPFAMKLQGAQRRLAQMGARGPAQAMAEPVAPGGGPAPAAGGAATATAMPDGARRVSPQIAAGAMGGWNANPEMISNAVKYLKSGGELAPQQRGSLDRLVRQTDQPMIRPARSAIASARPGSWRNL